MIYTRLVRRWIKLIKETKTTKYQMEQDKNYDVISPFIIFNMKI